MSEVALVLSETGKQEAAGLTIFRICGAVEFENHGMLARLSRASPSSPLASATHVSFSNGDVIPISELNDYCVSLEPALAQRELVAAGRVGPSN